MAIISHKSGPSEAATGSSLSPPEQTRVLIVDDDSDIGELLASGLELAGYQTETADNGEGAIRRLSSESFDLVIVDLLMPEVSGIRLIQWLRDERESSVPVVVFTGHDDRQTLESARKAGADEVMVKPAGLDCLRKVVERLVPAK